MNEWMTEWRSEWVTDVLKLKWNVRAVAWQGPSRPFRPTMVKRALHKLRENVTASACRTWGRVHPSLSLSIPLLLCFVRCTHSLIVASFCCYIIQNWQLNELSGLSNKAVAAIAAFSALFQSPSLPVCLSVCLLVCLPACPPHCPYICVRKYVACLFALLPFSLNWHLF